MGRYDEPSPGASYSRPSMERPALLIVDDEPRLLRLLVRVFEGEGFEVLPAADGDTALAILSGHDDPLHCIAAVLLDVFIPPRGAAEVLDAVLERQPNVGVVMVSGDRLGNALSTRLEAAGGVFIRKPFHPAAVIEAVKRAAASAAAGAPD